MNPDAGRSRKGLCKLLGYMPQAFLQVFAVASAQAGIDPERRNAEQKQAASKDSVCPVKNLHGSIKFIVRITLGNGQNFKELLEKVKEKQQNLWPLPQYAFQRNLNPLVIANDHNL